MLSMVCSDKTFSIINAAVVAGFAWAQVRQLIPAEWMAKLPTRLIVILEFVAANRGSANNDLFHNPCYYKRKKSLQSMNYDANLLS